MNLHLHSADGICCVIAFGNKKNVQTNDKYIMLLRSCNKVRLGFNKSEF